MRPARPRQPLSQRAPGARTTTRRPTSKNAAATKKLGHREQRELEGLPARIETLEQEQAALRVTLADASLYAKDPARASELYQRDAAIEEEMLTALARWEALSTA